MADGSPADFPKNAPNASVYRPSRAAQKLDEHLVQAIAELSPTQESTSPMRGMQRLAFLTQTATTAMDAKADAVADRIVAAQAKAESAIAKFDAFGGDIEKSAADIEAALGQISNGPPTA